MINDVKLIYITCGFLRLICSVLLTVCSHFKVNLSIGQFISFQKEQRLLPVFPLLNATVRIIEPLATTFRKELLSAGSEVQVLSGTPKAPLQAVFQRFAAFIFSSPGFFAPVKPGEFYALQMYILLRRNERFPRSC